MNDISKLEDDGEFYPDPIERATKQLKMDWEIITTSLKKFRNRSAGQLAVAARIYDLLTDDEVTEKNIKDAVNLTESLIQSLTDSLNNRTL